MKEEPPQDKNGKVIPFVGTRFNVDIILIKNWYIKIKDSPADDKNIKKLFSLSIETKTLQKIKMYKDKTRIRKKNPSSSPKSAKMKSE